MKATLLSAMLPMMLAVPGAYAATDLEALRTRCAEQEQQIQTLTEQVRTLRGGQSHPTEVATTPAVYTVRAGDSLERIARRNHCQATTLAKINGIKLSSMIHPGQKLKLPGSSTKESPARSATTPAPRTHKIGQGDTYYSISRKYGIPVNTLIAANPKAKATALYPGLVIRLTAEKPAEPAPVQPKPRTMTADSQPKQTPAISSPPKTLPVSALAQQPVEPLVVGDKTAQSPPAARPPSPPAEPSPPLEKKIRSVTIDGEMTYADFAAKHGTDTGRLNDLNGLDLTSATVLAKGSELYVPAQP